MLRLTSLIRIYYFPIYLYCLFYALCILNTATERLYIITSCLFCVSLWAIKMYKPKSIKTPRLFYPLIFMGCLTVVFSSNYIYFTHTPFTYFQYITFFLLPYLTTFVFFRFSCQGENEINFILLYFVLIFCFAVFRFFYFRSGFIEIYGEGRPNNTFYPVLMSIPILFLLRNRLLKMVILFVTIFVCILSLKRSATVCILIISLLFFLKEFIIGKRGKIIGILTLLLLLLLVFNVFDLSLFYDSVDNVILRFDNIESDKGSGRFDLTSRFFEKDIYDGKIIFGNGFYGYHNKYPDYVAIHNDLLEVFYSLGIMGLVAYLIFIWKYFKIVLFSFLAKSDLFFSYLCAFIILIVYIFAGGIISFVDLGLPFFSFIGLVQAIEVTRNKEQ